MSTTMKFEFDWEEVFNGIKLGVQKEITEELVSDKIGRASCRERG